MFGGYGPEGAGTFSRNPVRARIGAAAPPSVAAFRQLTSNDFSLDGNETVVEDSGDGMLYLATGSPWIGDCRSETPPLKEYTPNEENQYVSDSGHCGIRDADD
jgi:hypothetical protein